MKKQINIATVAQKSHKVAKTEHGVKSPTKQNKLHAHVQKANYYAQKTNNNLQNGNMFMQAANTQIQNNKAKVYVDIYIKVQRQH